MSVDNGREQEEFVLNNLAECLILAREDWHVIRDFTLGTVLLALASEHYDTDDYIYEGCR